MRTVALYELLPFAVSIAGSEERGFRGVAVDSRECEEGALFAALPGERTDGHHFIPDLIAGGVRAFLIARWFADENQERLDGWVKNDGASFLIAEDVLKTLQRAAEWYLSLMPQVRRIGITGSSGKTTVKELTAAVLGRRYRVAYTKGNLNSEIGLPLVAFSVDPDDEIAVFEMGINHPGEMDVLVQIVKPQTAVITNITSAHAGMFPDRDGLILEKMKILSRAGNELTAFVNQNDENRSRYESAYPGTYIKYGFGVTPAVEAVENLGYEGWRLKIGSEEIVSPLFGRYNLENICAAVAVGRAFGLTDEEVAGGIASVRSVGFGRSCLKNGRFFIIEDCYNANPGSMAAAVDLFRETPSEGRRIFVAGAMRELGTCSDECHRELGRQTAAAGFDAVLFYGEEAAAAFEAFEAAGGQNGFFTTDFEELKNHLAAQVHDGDHILLKGSRSLRLERLESVLV